MKADKSTRDQILSLIPQQKPFRFVDEILEMDEHTIKGAYTFKKDEFFYEGHFPENPVTPGVILIETMAQTGAVAHALYQMMLQGMNAEQIKNKVTLFSLADEIEFAKVVLPGSRVIVTGEKAYYRRGSFKSKVSMTLDGQAVCSGVLTGTGVDFNG